MDVDILQSASGGTYSSYRLHPNYIESPRPKLVHTQAKLETLGMILEAKRLDAYAPTS